MSDEKLFEALDILNSLSGALISKSLGKIKAKEDSFGLIIRLLELDKTGLFAALNPVVEVSAPLDLQKEDQEEEMSQEDYDRRKALLEDLVSYWTLFGELPEFGKSGGSSWDAKAYSNMESTGIIVNSPPVFRKHFGNYYEAARIALVEAGWSDEDSQAYLIQRYRGAKVYLENKNHKRTYNMDNNETLIENLNALIMKNGKRPSRSEWEKNYTIYQELGVPSLRVYEKRFGSLQNVWDRIEELNAKELEKEDELCEQDLPYLEPLAPENLPQ